MVIYLAAVHIKQNIVICVNGYFQLNLVHGVATQTAVLEQQRELHKDREGAVKFTLPLKKYP